MNHTGGKRANFVLWALAVAPAFAGGLLALQPVIEAESPSGFVDQAELGPAPTFQEADAIGVVATGSLGACCVAPSTCVNNQSLAPCNAQGGTFFLKENCSTDPCGFLSRACCSPAGVCTGDVTRATCEGGGGTWHIEASCAGAGNLPMPVCNRHDVNNCVWDNGLPLNDGGASRAHTHSAGAGQVPRYDFNTADDFILGGPDSTPCEVSSIRWYMRARPSDVTGPVFTPPNPEVDVIGVNVTVFENYIDPNTGLNSPAGFGAVPLDQNDLNPKNPYPSVPGGVVYARTFCTGTLAAAPGICPGPVGLLSFTLLPGFCDPPPAVGFETGAVYQVDITIDPPILLNKNTTYWLDVQGLFPFNDALRETLQTWWQPSRNNTGFRGMTQRTDNAAYCIGSCAVPTNPRVWRPTAVAPSAQGGNQGASAPCAGVPVNTRLDYAFVINGAKDVPGIANDLCADAVEVFDGVTPFDSTGAASDGPNPASCGTIEQDLWFTYAATCTGVLTISTCGSDFDSIVAIYDGTGCMGVGAPAFPGLGDGSPETAMFPARDDTPSERNPLRRISPPPQDGVGHPQRLALQTELGCNNNSNACGAGSDDGYVQVAVTDGDTYLIRVGGIGAAQGGGALTLDCQEICGVPTAGPCCAAHGPMVGCSNDSCCEIVCATTGFEYCCNNLAVGWDAACAAAASQIPACQCPCTFTCPGGATMETEVCGADTNGGCDNLPNPETFAGPLNLALGTPKNACGTLQASGTTRDMDWWQVNVPASGSGVATLNVIFNGGAPVGLVVLGRLDPADVAAGETFCTDKQCTGGTACEPAGACTEDSDCPPGEYCDQVGTTLLQYNSIATASCQPTDGQSNHCGPIVTCVPAPGTYVIQTFTTAADAECNLEGDGIFSGVTCGGQDDYGFTVTATDDCADGACCLCNGTCTDSLLNEQECLLSGGNFQGEGSLCTDASVDCAASAHGCATTQSISCGETVAVDLTGSDIPPEEPYICGAAGNDPPDRAWLNFTTPCVDDDGNPGANDCDDEPGTDITSVRLDTCDSVNPGRDSLFAILGSCCTGGQCASGAACTSAEFCGAACCDDTRPLTTAACDDDGCGFTDFLGDICATNLIEGETYLIQISSWDNDVTNSIFSLQLRCPCTGSCCDGAAAICTDNTPADECLEPLQFDTIRTCGQLNPACGVAACCHGDGTCTNTTLANCQGECDAHLPGAKCNSVMCNLCDTCDYNTGDPSSELSQATFGFRSQFAEDIGLFIEIADDFIMYGDGLNSCLMHSLRFTTFHTSHDSANDCIIGGWGGACFDLPQDYYGIIVTISEDVAGMGKAPTCVPDCTEDTCTAGADGDYHVGPGCVHSVVFGPASKTPPPAGVNWWEWYHQDESENILTLHFDPPLELEKDQKYWLAITPLWREVAGYSVIWQSSVNWNGNFSQFYSAQGIQEFVPLTATDNDQLFDINGAKQVCGCTPCALYADVVPASCLVDVDDLLCVLDDFVDPANCPGNGDIFPCGPDDALCPSHGDGIYDVDDIQAVLAAFNGFASCDDPCSPGACLLPTTLCGSNNEYCWPVGSSCDGGQGTCDDCRDGSFSPDGMSLSQCAAIGGTYQGDNTTCPP